MPNQTPRSILSTRDRLYRKQNKLKYLPRKQLREFLTWYLYFRKSRSNFRFYFAVVLSFYRNACFFDACKSAFHIDQVVDASTLQYRCCNHRAVPACAIQIAIAIIRKT